MIWPERLNVWRVYNSFPMVFLFLPRDQPVSLPLAEALRCSFQTRLEKEGKGSEKGEKTDVLEGRNQEINPIPSMMYGIFTYIWLILIVNVEKYTIHHGCYGNQ